MTQMTPDETYRALVSAELEAIVTGEPSTDSQRLFDELVDRREPGTDRVLVATVLREELNVALHLVFMSSGATGLPPLDVWARTALELAQEDAEAAEEANGA